MQDSINCFIELFLQEDSSICYHLPDKMFEDLVREDEDILQEESLGHMTIFRNRHL